MIDLLNQKRKEFIKILNERKMRLNYNELHEKLSDLFLDDNIDTETLKTILALFQNQEDFFVDTIVLSRKIKVIWDNKAD